MKNKIIAVVYFKKLKIKLNVNSFATKLLFRKNFQKIFFLDSNVKNHNYKIEKIFCPYFYIYLIKKFKFYFFYFYLFKFSKK